MTVSESSESVDEFSSDSANSGRPVPISNSIEVSVSAPTGNSASTEVFASIGVSASIGVAASTGVSAFKGVPASTGVSASAEISALTGLSVSVVFCLCSAILQKFTLTLRTAKPFFFQNFTAASKPVSLLMTTYSVSSFRESSFIR